MKVEKNKKIDPNERFIEPIGITVIKGGKKRKINTEEFSKKDKK